MHSSSIFRIDVREHKPFDKPDYILAGGNTYIYTPPSYSFSPSRPLILRSARDVRSPRITEEHAKQRRGPQQRQRAPQTAASFVIVKRRDRTKKKGDDDDDDAGSVGGTDFIKRDKGEFSK